MDFYIDIGAAVMLRALQAGDSKKTFRKVFLKLFRAIAQAYNGDKDFQDVSTDHLLKTP